MRKWEHPENGFKLLPTLQTFSTLNAVCAHFSWIGDIFIASTLQTLR